MIPRSERTGNERGAERRERTADRVKTDRVKTDRVKALAPLPGWRIGVVFALLVTGLGLMWLKAGRLQLALGDDLRTLAEEQYLRQVRLAAPRGQIKDARGTPLAVSVPVWSVYAEPRRVDDKEGVAKALSLALGVDKKVVRAKLQKDAAFQWIARRIEPERADEVRALDLPGVGLRKEMRRFFPQGDLAAQLLGTVDLDGDGRGGVEQAVDARLQGRATQVPSLTDNKGRRIAVAEALGKDDLDALEGDDVTLTLDAELQHHAEEAVAAAVREHNAKSGFAIVLDAKTAAVRAVVNVPSFNPNAAPQQNPAARNRAFSDAFEPGSIFKMATFAAAFEAGVLKSDDLIFCENGRFQLGRHVIHDSHKAEWLTAADVFSQSSNIGTLKIAQRVGEERFQEALVRYGFGAVPGTGLVEETAGRLPKTGRWGDARLATVSFGHGVLVSALQVASFTQAIANNGVRHRPFLVQKVETAAGEIVVDGGADAGERLFSTAVAQQLTMVMEGVVAAGGTGTLAAIPGITVAGKTGTAEKVDPVTKRYSKELHLSSFVGFAPVEDPRVVAIVVLDEPRGQVFGGTTAGPAWRRIVEQALLQEGVLSGGALQAVASAPVAPDAPTAAAPTSALDEGARVRVLGDEDVGAAVPGEPPVLVGLTLRQAIVAAEERGFLLEVTGSGLVAKQQKPHGARIAVTLKPQLAQAAAGGVSP